MPSELVKWGRGKRGLIGGMAGESLWVEQATVDAYREVIHAKGPGVKADLLTFPAQADWDIRPRKIHRTMGETPLMTPRHQHLQA